MWKDTIVEETRKVREEYAAQFDYDLEAVYRDLKEKEKQSEREVVSLAPKPPNGPGAYVNYLRGNRG